MFKNLKQFLSGKLNKLFTNTILMAFTSGTAAEDGVETTTRYKGITPVTVLAINPTKDKLKELTGRVLSEEPKYLSTNKDGKPQIRLDFIIKTDPNFGNKIDKTFSLNTFLVDTVRVNKDNTKFQVIDNYGNTTWVTKEEFQNKTLPEYASKMTSPYRPALVGEEELIHILKTWLNIPDSHHYDVNNSVWKLNENLKGSEAYLSNPKALFKGDLKELTSLVTPHKDYKFKVCVGIKSADTGKKYQDVFNRLVLKNGSTYYERFTLKIEDAQKNGAYANTEFSYQPLAEENVVPTDLAVIVDKSPGIPGVVNSSPLAVPDTSFLNEEFESTDLPF